HARIDTRQVRRVGSLQRQSAAIGLLQQVTREADHVANSGNGSDLAQDDVKIDALERRIALEIELQRRAAAPVRLVAARFRLERHRYYWMILIVFTDALQRTHDGNSVALELSARADAREHENLRRVIHTGAEHDFVCGGGVLVGVFSIENAFDLFTV